MTTMTSIVIKLSEDKLLELKEIAAQLGVAPEELARTGVEAMLTKRDEGSSFSDTEAELLRNIKQRLPPDVEKRYLELNAKGSTENLTPEEHSKLLKLVTQVEEMQAR